MDACIEVLMGEKFAVGISCGGKSIGYRNPGATQVADHFTQRRILAAHLIYIPHAQLVKPGHVLRHNCSPFIDVEAGADANQASRAVSAVTGTNARVQ
jgi:hypothetical protein